MSIDPELPGTKPNAENSDAPSDKPSPVREPELPRWATRNQPGRSISDAQFAAFIGRKWTTTYARKLMHFREDPSFVPTWNWAAAVFTSMWFLYRKLYMAFAVFYLLPGIVYWYLIGDEGQLTAETALLPENRPYLIMRFAIVLSTSIAAGGTANWLLFRRARAASAIVAMQQLPEEASLALLNRIGGVNRTPTVVLVLCTMVLALAAAMASTATK